MDAVVIGAENAHSSKCLLVIAESGFFAVLSGYRRGGKPAKYRYFLALTRHGRTNLAWPENRISNFRDTEFAGSIISGVCGIGSAGFTTRIGVAASQGGSTGTMDGADATGTSGATGCATGSEAGKTGSGCGAAGRRSP
jgi:hypothetical protein